MVNKKEIIKSIADDKLLKAVVGLIKEGLGSINIARRLNIPESRAYKLIKKARENDPKLPQPNSTNVAKTVLTPEVLREVRTLVQQGMSASKVAEALNLKGKTAEKAVTIVRREIKDLGEPLPLPVTKLQDFNPGERYQSVKYLVEQGLPASKISEELNITLDSARYWVTKVNSGRMRMNRIDEIRVDLDEGQYETYDLAKKYSRSIASINLMKRKAELEFSPASDWIKGAAYKGVLLSKLKYFCNIQTVERGKEVLEENFPKSFIIETKVNDDVLLTPVYSSKEEIEWLNGKVEKDFDYYKSPEDNYLCVKFKDDLPYDEITIWNLTDLHSGNVGCRTEVIDKIVETIKNNPGHYAVTTGDLTESITKISVGNPEDQYLNNSEQVLDITKRLLPIRHKLLAYRTGNHCTGRLMKAGQFNPGLMIGSMLEIPTFNTRVIVDIYFKGVRKTLSLEHKYGGAFRLGQIEDAVDRIKAYSTYFVNCWFSGHIHKSMVLPKESLELTPGRGFTTQRWWIAIGGSTVQRTGTYAEENNYGPTPQDFLYYTFDINGKDSVDYCRLDSI